MKISEIEQRLDAAGISEAKYEARLLASHFEGIPVSQLIIEDPELTNVELAYAVERREKREPLQYIIGGVDFYREHYKVSPDCLIPRSDTEILVDYAVKNLPKNAIFADLCTGSGCIAVSVLANRPDLSALAFDISENALKIARENAEINGVTARVEFFAQNLLLEAADIGNAEYILSNPPYIPADVIRGLDAELFFEPKIALDGGEDGLVFYRRMLTDYPCVKAFIFEIGYDQAAEITALAEQNGRRAEIIKDFSQNDRLAVLTK